MQRLLLVLSVIATPLAAQDLFQPPSLIQATPPGGLAPATAMTGGHLFGNVGLDAIGLFGTQPVAYYQPEVFRAPVPIPVTATDLAVYPRTLPDPDWVLATGPAGLTRWTWNGSAFVDDSQNPPGSVWIDATGLGVADLDGRGAQDLYAVNAARTAVILSRTAVSAWTTFVTLPVPGEILEVVPVQWNGIRFFELAVRTRTSLRVINYTGAVLAMIPLADGNGFVQSVAIPGATRDAVLVTSGSGASENLVLLSSDGIHQTIPLPFANAIGAAFGDLSLDGLPDFALSHASGPDLKLFGGHVAASGLLTFAQNLSQTSIAISNWTTFDQNRALPGLADFDYDGDIDVLFPPTGANRLDLFGGTLVDEMRHWPLIVAGELVAVPGGSEFHLTLSVPPTFDSGGWTDIETYFWLQPRFDYLVEPTPVLGPLYHSVPETNAILVTLPTPHSEWFEDIYHLESRYVERVNGTVVRIGPGVSEMVGLAEPLLALCELEGVLVNGEFSGVTFAVPPEFEYPNPPYQPIDPVLIGTPNPRFAQHEVTYTYNVETGTWGGGSGCLPDVPDNGSGAPPQK